MGVVIRFTLAESCALVSPIIAPLSFGANLIEDKFKNNSYIQTAAKIVQSFPLNYFSLLYTTKNNLIKKTR